MNGNYYYYLYNGHGDVTQVIDQNGNKVNSYTYDEWGNILYKQELLSQPLKYAGEYYDEESGLYYLRARYYDPTIGRFISRDSYGGDITNPLSLNSYTYVENNPLGYIDPSGHFSIGTIIRVAVSVAVKVVVKAASSSSSSHKSKGGASSKGSGSSRGSSSSSSEIIRSIGNMAASLIGGFVDLVGGKYSDQFSKSKGVLLASADPYAIPWSDGMSAPQIKAPSLSTLGRAFGSIGLFFDILLSNPKPAGETPEELEELRQVPDMPTTPPDQPPGDGWEWRGSGEPGSGNGNWYNPKTGQSLNPDLNHPEPIGPHWDFRARDTKSKWRLFPDGRKERVY
ncbi:RHS repeat-associated core domain-containing protein [Pelotomaculum sp. FP]|uniref:RHS repeat-associated core domain-containing protein n=1 Tax=Pelotomaculum sp. FP TaxID=261474 RepID=UPI001065E379|nr:RHS repeat-associated core domain-containing protein [Pelotomaculum sp. FP]